MSEIKVNSIKGVGATAAAISVDNSNGTCTLASGSKLNNCTTDGTTNLTIADGNLVVGTAGHGIDFSATADGSGTSTSELFTEYEEGTWTPDLRVASYLGNANQFTYTNRTGCYTKIGREVQVSAYWQVSNYNSYSGDLYLFGLPFAPVQVATNINPVLTLVGDGANLTNNDMMFVFVDGNNDRGAFGHQGNTGWSRITVAELDQYGMYLSGTYTT
tara:strand:+ start:939 stop:1586 length:648 start_codon:yes stop_codon:yes gene_type:complete